MIHTSLVIFLSNTKISVNSDPGFFLTKPLNQMAFHGADHNIRRKPEITAALDQIMVTGIFLVHGDQRLILKITDAEVFCPE